MKKIFLIGGGTGGHILPLKNLSEELIKLDAEVTIIVSDSHLDREIVKKNFFSLHHILKTKSQEPSIIYFKTGKIRRYLSWENFTDFFRIINSIFKARKIIKQEQPDVLFFKGGFVGFPFFIAAKFLMRYPGKIYSHESDTVPGKLTQMVSKYADGVFESFGEPPMPLFYTPSNENLQTTNAEQEKKIKTEDCRLKIQKHLLIFGASQGAQFINETFLANAHKLCGKYFVTLISGTGKGIEFQHKNFKQFSLVSAQELSQLIQQSDLIISRAGSSSMFEIITAKKPSIIIPLPSAAQNHQVKNGEYFERKGLCKVLLQNEQTKDVLLETIKETLSDSEIQENLDRSEIKNCAKEIAEKILN